MWMEAGAVWWMWADRMYIFLVAGAVGAGDGMFMLIARADLPAGVWLMAAVGMEAEATVNSTKI
jgi:hypothetical protein